MEETFIKLETKDGKQYSSTRSYEGLLEQINELQQNVLDFQYRIRGLESPGRQKQVLDILKRDGTRSRIYFYGKIANFDDIDLWKLVKDGKVAELRHGTRLMYSLVHSPIKET